MQIFSSGAQSTAIPSVRSSAPAPPVRNTSTSSKSPRTGNIAVSRS